MSKGLVLIRFTDNLYRLKVKITTAPAFVKGGKKELFWQEDFQKGGIKVTSHNM